MTDQFSNSVRIKGKTYSLYGETNSTDEYYRNVSILTNELLQQFGGEDKLFHELKKVINKKHIPSNFGERNFDTTKFLSDKLSVYTNAVRDHLNSLPFTKRFKRVFTLSEQQYHLYMIFIELVNRINIINFKSSEYKIAFLPHCIKDRSVTCMSVKDDIDYRCKNCSKICQVNLVSKTLRRNKILPYIWMTADLKKLFKVLRANNSSIGVLGIACIPELVNGMQFCGKYDLPVVGIPLDANRCVRWMGEFYDNTINLNELDKLLN